MEQPKNDERQALISSSGIAAQVAASQAHNDAGTLIQLNQVNHEQVCREIRELGNITSGVKVAMESGIRNIAWSIVGVGALALATWMLLIDKIDKLLWSSIMVIVLSPFFGEAVRRALHRAHVDNDRFADYSQRLLLFVGIAGAAWGFSLL